MNEDLYQKMAQSVLDGDSDAAAALARQAIAAGIDPLEAITQGFVKGVNTVGESFACGQAFLPELVMAGASTRSKPSPRGLSKGSTPWGRVLPAGRPSCPNW